MKALGGLDLFLVAVLPRHPAHRLRGAPPQEGRKRGLLPGRAGRGVAPDRGEPVRDQHRRRAPGRAGGHRGLERPRRKPFRVARRRPDGAQATRGGRMERARGAGPARVLQDLEAGQPSQFPPGPASCSAPRSWASGTGAPTSTWFSASWPRNGSEARLGTICAGFLKLLRSGTGRGAGMRLCRSRWP